MTDISSLPPSGLEAAKRRREGREELLRWLTFLCGLIPVLTAALGFSPLTNIWSFLALIAASAAILASVWFHARGSRASDIVGLVGKSGTRLRAMPLSNRQQILQRAAVVAFILGLGAWLGSSGRNAFLLAVYGSLGDLAISPGQGMAEPAIISLRPDDRNDTCFYTTATFNIRNATDVDATIGVVSNDLLLSDNSNGQIFSRRNRFDVTATNAGVSGVTLVTGSDTDWPKYVEARKTHLTSLRRGESKNVTVFQDRDNAAWGNTCLPDKEGKIPAAYKATTVTVAGTVVLVMPGGDWRAEGFSVTEPVTVKK